MWDSVRNYWTEFNEPLEGRVRFMYCDVKGLVSTGVGNLIDATGSPMTAPSAAQRAASLQMAAEFNWTVGVGGPVASFDDVAAAWDAVKSRMDLASGGHRSYEDLTSLRIADEEINRMIFVKVDSMESFLRGRAEFADFDNWPADAQLAVLSMSWGMGPAFKFPTFQGLVSSGQWAAAADECRFQPDVGTIRLRNILDAQSLRNAGRVVAEGHDASFLAIDLSNSLGVQIALQHLGFDVGGTDGASGPRTAAAVRQFQTEAGLDPTGVPSDIALTLAVQLTGEGFTTFTG